MNKKTITIVDENGENKGIEMSPVRGKHTKKGWAMLAEMQKNSDDPESVNKYLEWRDSLVAELCGMSVDELDELASEEKQKLTSVLDDKVQGELGFTRR